MNESPGNLKVVFDTNIYIAAFLKNGLADFLLRLSHEGHYQLYISAEITNELELKLRYKFKADEIRISQFLEEVSKSTTRIKTTSEIKQPVVVADTNDDKILICALDAKAHLIISLDKHLLNLKKFKGISIIHPKTMTWMIPDY